MRRILIFDTETTGFIQKKKPMNDVSQPRVLQLAYILMTESGRVIEERNMLFSPLLSDDEQYEIPSDATEVNGIDTEFAIENGWKQKYLPMIFDKICQKANLIVGHNVNYDISVMKVAYARFMDKEHLAGLLKKPTYCTMEEASDIVKIPPTERMLKYGIKGYKNPSLSEAYRHFFNEDLDGAHDAMVDTKASAKIYREIENMKIDHEPKNHSTPEF